MTTEEKKDALDLIRKALDLIDNSAFEILQDVEIESARGWAIQFREAHENLGEMIDHLADLAGVDEEREEEEL